MRAWAGVFKSGGSRTKRWLCASGFGSGLALPRMHLCTDAHTVVLVLCTVLDQVVHRKMPQRLPAGGDDTGLSLLLLAGSVEYLRGNKYCSIASLTAHATQDQDLGKARVVVEEEEYLRVAVERILMQRPDLLMLEGFMAQAGLSVCCLLLLLARGLSCLSVLDRRHKMRNWWLATKVWPPGYAGLPLSSCHAFCRTSLVDELGGQRRA